MESRGKRKEVGNKKRSQEWRVGVEKPGVESRGREQGAEKR